MMAAEMTTQLICLDSLGTFAFMKLSFAMLWLVKPEGEAKVEDGPPSRITPLRRAGVVQGMSGETVR